MSSVIDFLPAGWDTASIDELVRIIDYRGRTPPYSQEGIPHLRSSNIRNFGVIWDGLKYVTEEIFQEYMTRGLPEEGDVLLTTEGPLGEVALAPNIKFSLAQRMMLLRTDRHLLLPEYLMYQLANPEFQARLKGHGTGTTVKGISARNFKPLKIYLSPLNEQHRIVAKIEALTTRSRNARAALAAIPPLLDQFRQSVLAAAFRGDLTADWRAQNPDVEPAEKLLERIRINRLPKASSSKQREKISKIYDFQEVGEVPDLPDSWRSTYLEKLAESLNYGTSAKSAPSGEVPVLRMGNLQGGEIDWDNLVYSSNEGEINKYSLKPYTVLFNRTNSPELVGKTSIYRGQRAAIFAGYLIRINNFEELDPEYLNYYLNSNYAKAMCWRVKTDGVSQSNINAQKLGKFEIPFCSLQEQQKIVQKVDRYFACIRAIEKYYQDNHTNLNSLDQSILAKAFRGQLVTQDTNDEPASVLLERIRAEREKIKKKTGKGGKGKGKRKR